MKEWAVLKDDAGRVHVVPCFGDGEPFPDHHAGLGCPCRPQLIREGPLDDPVISHREPGHPGANTPMDA